MISDCLSFTIGLVSRISRLTILIASAENLNVIWKKWMCWNYLSRGETVNTLRCITNTVVISSDLCKISILKNRIKNHCIKYIISNVSLKLWLMKSRNLFFEMQHEVKTYQVQGFPHPGICLYTFNPLSS